MSSSPTDGRFRAYLRFVAAVFWFFIARSLARHGAEGLVSAPWYPLAEQAILAFLLILGFAWMGSVFDRQQHPIQNQGLPLRTGLSGEVGTGLALGWTLALLCVLALTILGGISVGLSLQPSAWAWFATEAAFFALVALAEEVAFRGYAFQHFASAVGPFTTSICFAIFYGGMQSTLPGSNRASLAVSLALSLLLSTAYLRTRALWLGWGLNFGWKASRALLFGLALSGSNTHSPVVQGNPMGPFWLTGGGFGLDGSWLAFVLLLAALPVLFRLTRDLDYRHNALVVVPGGIPIDLSAAANQQHQAAIGPTAAAPPQLVQIFPASAPPPQSEAQ